MSLKKYLKSHTEATREEAMRENLLRNKPRKCGQASVEYFILLTLLASLTIIGISHFFSRVQYNTDRVLQFAVDAWKQPVVGYFDTSGMSVDAMDNGFSH